MRTPQAERVRLGKEFDRLEVCGESYMKPYGKYGLRRICPVRCKCGNELEVWAAHLLNGNTRSCGCLQKERLLEAVITHGERHSQLYGVWCGMKSRCYNPKNKRFDRYGGRGITICDQWINDFAVFRDWAKANGYRDDLTIERIRVNENYEPSNCTWIPNEEQALNRTNRHDVTAFGETKSLQDWSRDPRCMVVRLTLHSRLKAGWDPDVAISTPPQKAGLGSNFFRVKSG